MTKPILKSNEQKLKMLSLEKILRENINYKGCKVEIPEGASPDFNWSYFEEGEIGAWISQKLNISKATKNGDILIKYTSIVTFDRNYEPVRVEAKSEGWATAEFSLTEKEIKSIMETLKLQDSLNISIDATPNKKLKI